MHPTLSILIYTYNSESHISDCIQSAKLLTDTVIVIDQKSTDRTKELAIENGAKYVAVPHHLYVEPVRMAGVNSVETDWFLILDADERMTKELAQEIKAVISNDELRVRSYAVPRKNIFAKKIWLKHGGWFPDYQTRLIKRSAISDWPKKIHSTPVISGQQARLQNPMIHYFHGDIEDMVKKTAVYEEIESELLFDAKRDSSTPIFFRKFFGELFRRLVKQAGWKDGILGVIECFYQAYSKTITYLFLYEKQKT